MSNYATLGAIAPFDLLQHAFDRLALGIFLLRKLSIGLLEFSHRHICLDMDTAMSWTFVCVHSHIDLFIEDLAFFVHNQRSVCHAPEIASLVIFAILLQRSVFLRLVARFHHFLTIVILWLLDTARYEDSHAFFGLDEHLDSTAGIEIEISGERVIALSTGFR